MGTDTKFAVMNGQLLESESGMASDKQGEWVQGWREGGANWEHRAKPTERRAGPPNDLGVPCVRDFFWGLSHLPLILTNGTAAIVPKHCLCLAFPSSSTSHESPRLLDLRRAHLSPRCVPAPTCHSERVLPTPPQLECHPAPQFPAPSLIPSSKSFGVLSNPKVAP